MCVIERGLIVFVAPGWNHYKLMAKSQIGDRKLLQAQNDAIHAHLVSFQT